MIGLNLDGTGDVSEGRVTPSAEAMSMEGGDGVPAGPTVLAERYRLGRLLGEGAVCRVQEARDLLLERDVVVKVVDGLADEGDRSRAVRAARAAARVVDPHVVRVLDVQHGTPPFLVLEALDARPLDLRALKGLSAGRLLAVADELLAGLAALHEAGAVHGDVRAQNVLVTPERIVLTSAGIERAATGGQGASAGSDVAAAGALVRDLFAGRVPEVEPALARAVSSRGYPDAGAFRSALLAAGAHARPQPAPPPAPALAPPAPVPDAAKADPAPAAPAQPPQAASGPTRATWVAIAAAVVLLGLGLAGQRVRTTAARTPSPPPATAPDAPSATAPDAPSPSASDTPTPTPVPSPSTGPALDELLARTDLDIDTQGDRELLARLRGLGELAGPERAAGAAELLGVIVEYTRQDRLSRTFARDAFDALAPEVTVDGLVALAERDPAAAGPDGAPFVERLRGLGGLRGEPRAAEAVELFALASGPRSALPGPFGAAVTSALFAEVTVEGLVAAAERDPAAAGPDGAPFVERLRGLGGLRGEPRAAEAVELFALASGPGSVLPGPFGAAASAALLPEVTVEGLVALGERDPSVLGPGGAPFVERLRGLGELQGERRAAEASSLLREVDEAGVELTPVFQAAAVKVLRPLAAGA